MHPPLDDPTMPYHSTAYLLGALRAHGVAQASIRDINIEFVSWSLEPDRIRAFYREVDVRKAAFLRCDRMTMAEQDEYWHLCGSVRQNPTRIAAAAQEMRMPEAFLDYERYQINVACIRDYFSLLGALSYPAGINDFRHTSNGKFSLYNLNDLFDNRLSERTVYPFAQFFDQQLVFDAELQNAECLGLSIVYDHQLMHAMWFARRLKTLWPEKFIIIGGTAISQYYKHLSNKQNMKRFFDACDVIVVGEGETAICNIADCKGKIESLSESPNTITYSRDSDTLYLPQKIHYENVAKLPAPIYSHLWDLYLAPYRGINYSPTRGCYWNRCTFCDYGLNDTKPTSPWRERPVDLVVADLKESAAKEGVKYVYFAVDVIAPGYLERIADAVVAAGLDIRWSAELRMEKIFAEDRCKALARSGCVCVSFGMESGNQRVLDLIDKGTKVEFMGQTMKNFSNAGIAVQLMAFQGFPTETSSERQATIRFVEEHRDHWSTGWLGTFRLTGSALVAKDPGKFGIELIHIKGVDCGKTLAYNSTTSDGTDHGSSDLIAEGFEAWFHRNGGLFPRVHGRPWAGGTDALHSIIYYDKYGRWFFRDNPLRDAPSTWHEVSDLNDMKIHLKACLLSSNFDLSTICANRNLFSARLSELAALHTEATFSLFQEWQAKIPPIMRETSLTYWSVSSSNCIRLDAELYTWLQMTSERKTSLGSFLESMPARERIRFAEFLRRIEAIGVIQLDRANIDLDAMQVVVPGVDCCAENRSGRAILGLRGSVVIQDSHLVK
jgi:anaerobic magnesium-protoporphyrin IX monomethyl ester cyclase